MLKEAEGIVGILLLLGIAAVAIYLFGDSDFSKSALKSISEALANSKFGRALGGRELPQAGVLVQDPTAGTFHAEGGQRPGSELSGFKTSPDGTISSSSDGVAAGGFGGGGGGAF